MPLTLSKGTGSYVPDSAAGAEDLTFVVNRADTTRCGWMDLNAFRTLHFPFPSGHRDVYSSTSYRPAVRLMAVEERHRRQLQSWLTWNEINWAVGEGLELALSDLHLYPLAARVRGQWHWDQFTTRVTQAEVHRAAGSMYVGPDI